jgi:glycerol-3-phosphate dehydrogenase subunit C
MKTILDWSSYKDAGMGDAYADIPKQGGDFARAVAVCINSGQCELENRNVMCPSYRVTQNPFLSPRGRVKLLKSALNGQESLHNPELLEAMQLCLACKACKRECENNIDIAMIKVEYLAQYYHQNKVPMRTRLLSNVPKLLSQYPFLFKFTAIRNRIKPLAKMGEWLTGLNADRQLPVPVKKKFTSKAISSLDSNKTFHSEVVLLIDTFTHNFAPENADAAIAILNRAGYRVYTTESSETDVLNEPRPLCCGRTYIANGLVESARQEAARMIAALLPHVDAGRKIIGLEPACLLAIRDDYRFLGFGEVAEKVSQQALLLEEFIAREVSAKRFNVEFKTMDKNQPPVLIHGHCHQKAVGAMKSMRKVLKLIPQLNFEFIEASCCGMAGSFGLEKEHGELSLKMGEQALFPSIRNNPQATLIANGFSCRHQIQEGVERPSMHIAQLLHQYMT